MEKYILTVAGIKRELPIVKLNEGLSIASFVILGDTELVTATAKQLAKKLPDLDVLMTAEAKGIPLIHELSQILNMDKYIVARKSIKPYMENPLVHEVRSITTEEKQILCLDGKDAEFLKGKKIGLIDDVISTGASIKVLEDLVELAGGQVATKAAILAEGDAANREDIIFLEHLPLF